MIRVFIFPFYLLQSGIIIGTTSLGPAIVLAGCLLALRDTPVHLKWLCHLVYTRYGIQSIYLNLYSNRSALECSKKMCFFKDPMQYLKFADMEGDISVDYWVLLGFILIIKISAFIVLYLRASRVR